jgi:hypothetical protein
MARRMRRSEPWRLIVAIALLLAVVGGLLYAWQDYRDRAVVTKPVEAPDGPAVTQIVTARMAGMGQLRVARLSGIVQAAATDTRWGGLLKSGRVAKMPYSVDYTVDLSLLSTRDLQWNEAERTLIVDAPDIVADRANVDEGQAVVVERSGTFVTRGAGEALGTRVSRAADRAAVREATSPERLAQARELARGAIARTLAAPLNAAGQPDARVVVTFPAERGRSGARWDQSRTPAEVLGNGQ